MGVHRDWQSVHPIRALARDGRSKVLGELAECQKKHPQDFKKVLKVLRYVGEMDRVRNELHVKQGDNHKAVYELRAGQVRLFFFYSPDSPEVVVCTNYYWKAKESEAEQDRHFALCDMMRREYLKAVAKKA